MVKRKAAQYFIKAFFLFFLLQSPKSFSAESFAVEGVDLDTHGLEMRSLGTSTNPSAAPRLTPSLEGTLPRGEYAFLCQEEDQSYGPSAVQPLSIIKETGLIVNKEGHPIVNLKGCPFVLLLPKDATAESYYWVATMNTDPALTLMRKSSDMKNQASLKFLYQNPLRSTDSPMLHIPLYSQDKIYQFFLAQALTDMVTSWIDDAYPEELEEELKEVLISNDDLSPDSIEIERFAYLYTLPLVASIVTDLVSPSYNATRQLSRMLKRSIENLSLSVEDQRSFQNYLEGGDFFYPAFLFAREHHYGLSLIVLISLSAVYPSPEGSRDEALRSFSKQFVTQCYWAQKPYLMKFHATWNWIAKKVCHGCCRRR